MANDIKLSLTLQPVQNPIGSIASLQQRCDSPLYIESLGELFKHDKNDLGENIFTSVEVEVPTGKFQGIINHYGSDEMGFNRGIGQELHQSEKEIFFDVGDHGVWFPVDMSRISGSPLMDNNETRIYSGFKKVMFKNRAQAQIEAMLAEVSRVESLTNKLNDPAVDPVSVLLSYLNKLPVQANKILMSLSVFRGIMGNPRVQEIFKTYSGDLQSWLENKLKAKIFVPEKEKDNEMLGNRIFILYATEDKEEPTAGYVFDQNIKADFVDGTWGRKEERVILRWLAKPEEGHVGTIIYKGSCAYDVKISDSRLFFVLDNVIDPALEALSIPSVVNSGQSVEVKTDPALIKLVEELVKANEKGSETDPALLSAIKELASSNKNVADLIKTLDKPAETPTKKTE